jgi:hypothetical protein
VGPSGSKENSSASNGQELSDDVRKELGSLISQQLEAYFGEYDEDDLQLAQDSPRYGADFSYNLDQDIALATAASLADQQRVQVGEGSGAGPVAGPSGMDNGAGAGPVENNVIDECLAEIEVLPRRGADIPDNIAKIVNNAFRTKLPEEVRSAKMKMFDVPANCPGLDRVKVNQTMWEKVGATTHTMNVKLQQVQGEIVTAGAGICHILADVSKMEPEKVTGPSISELTKKLLNVQVLVGQANVDLNHRRRELMKSDLNSKYQHLCAQSVPFTDMLFGDDLGGQVRDISDANRVCSKIFPTGSRGRGMHRGRGSRFRPYHFGRGFGRGRGGGFGQRQAYGYQAFQGYAPRPAREGAQATVRRSGKPDTGEVCKLEPVGGRLSNYVNNWKEITTDKDLLADIEGIKLEFSGDPKEVSSFPVIVRAEREMANLNEEIQKLLDKAVIERCEWSEDQVLSSVFLIPKPDGSFRTIFNMKRLNEVIKYHHFKMDTLDTAESMLRPHWWMATVDLKDAYFSLSVQPQFRKYLRFALGNQVYQFCAMPMGLSSAPRVFTKILKPVLAKLRQNGIMCMAYIDDLLIVAPSEQQCQDAVSQAVSLLCRMGFMINEAKSKLVPAQVLRYLGFTWNSIKMKAS